MTQTASDVSDRVVEIMCVRCPHFDSCAGADRDATDQILDCMPNVLKTDPGGYPRHRPIFEDEEYEDERGPGEEED